MSSREALMVRQLSIARLSVILSASKVTAPLNR
jgi:hypothetical protein